MLGKLFGSKKLNDDELYAKELNKRNKAREELRKELEENERGNRAAAMLNSDGGGFSGGSGSDDDSVRASCTDDADADADDSTPTGGGGGGGGGADAERDKDKERMALAKKLTASGSKSDTRSRDVVLSSLKDLPDDCRQAVRDMKCSPVDLEANLRVLAMVLTFTDKRRPRRTFRTPADVEARADREGWKKTANVHPPRCLLSDADAFPVMCIKDALAMFKLGAALGEGGFGQVYEARTGGVKCGLPAKTVALKVIPHTSERARANNIYEASFMRALAGNANVCEMYKSFRVDNEVWLALELMAGGTIKAAASSQHGEMDETHIAYVANEMLQGIAAMHAKQIAHRDLKNLNVMLTIDGRVKLVDFGLAADMSYGPRIQCVGSPYWLPPEMIRGEPHDLKVDVWSMMVCLLELANRRPPYMNRVRRGMFNVGVRGLKCGEVVYRKGQAEPSEHTHALVDPGRWSPTFHDFLDRCQEMRPADRPSAATLLQHDFLKKKSSVDYFKEKIRQIFFLRKIKELL